MQNNSTDNPSMTSPLDATTPINGTPTTSTSSEATPGTPASSVVPGTVTTPTPTATEQERRPRPPKTKPSFVALDVHLPREVDLRQPVDSPLPDHTLRMRYEIALHGGREEFLRVKSELVMPLALEVENLPQTDVSFPEMIDQVIIRPVVTKFRSFLQRRFDAASRVEAEKEVAAKSSPSPIETDLKASYPKNGAELSNPTKLVKPKAVWPHPTN